jgi:primosomal protein DnaI
MKNVNEVINKLDVTALKHSFMDACSDKSFKDYVDSLNINYDILMKYTSRLGEAYLEKSNCATCKGLGFCKNKVRGYKLSPSLSGKIINFSYLVCPKLEKELEDNKYLDNVSLYMIPEELKKANFKDIYKDDKNRIPIIKYFKDFMDKKESKGLYLSGSFGSGKTYLICALFNELAKKGVKSSVIYYPEFLRSLKAGFGTDYNERYEYIKKVPLLLLDDIGAEAESNWSRDEILGPILQYRMDQNIPTFFTSNLSLKELEEVLAITNSGVDKVKARRIIERIKQLTNSLELISKNRRD